MAYTEGNLGKTAWVYHASALYNWEIRSDGSSYFFVESMGRSREGDDLYRWTSISIGEAMLMKKADKIMGDINDSGQKGKAGN